MPLLSVRKSVKLMQSCNHVILSGIILCAKYKHNFRTNVYRMSSLRDCSAFHREFASYATQFWLETMPGIVFLYSLVYIYCKCITCLSEKMLHQHCHYCKMSK